MGGLRRPVRFVDPTAIARARQLRAEGLSFAAIAARLRDEGNPVGVATIWRHLEGPGDDGDAGPSREAPGAVAREDITAARAQDDQELAESLDAIAAETVRVAGGALPPIGERVAAGHASPGDLSALLAAGAKAKDLARQLRGRRSERTVHVVVHTPLEARVMQAIAVDGEAPCTCAGCRAHRGDTTPAGTP